jgi:hypothetical protein
MCFFAISQLGVVDERPGQPMQVGATARVKKHPLFGMRVRFETSGLVTLREDSAVPACGPSAATSPWVSRPSPMTRAECQQRFGRVGRR